MIQVVKSLNCLRTQSDASHESKGGFCLNGGEDQDGEHKKVGNFPSALPVFRAVF